MSEQSALKNLMLIGAYVGVVLGIFILTVAEVMFLAMDTIHSKIGGWELIRGISLLTFALVVWFTSKRLGLFRSFESLMRSLKDSENEY